VARVDYRYEVDAAGLAAALEPLDGLVVERADGDGRFTVEGGPFRSFERTVTTEPAEDPGRFVVHEHVEFSLAIPVFGVIFVGPVKHALRPGSKHRTSGGPAPWWAPPDALDARASHVLGLLAALSVATGYLGTLLSQTITYAAEEFGASDTAQGQALAAARIGVLLSMVVIGLADRVGRRRALVVGLQIGALVMTTVALSPNLIAFTAGQTVARGFTTAAIVLLAILAVEEMPAGSRAYAVSVMTMAGALGGGMVLWFLPFTDLDPAAWRLLYVVPLGWFFVVRLLSRTLPESARFQKSELTDADDAASRTHDARMSHWGRLALLASSQFLIQLYFAPSAQFLNEFLRDERGFDQGWMITVFSIVTNLPGAIGIIVGGRLADTRGRRVIGSIALVVGVGTSVLMYNVSGASMWAWSFIGSLIGAAIVPALGVYGPELFPTHLRGKANSAITLLGVLGAAIGLLVAGALSDRWGSFGPAMALLAIGPAILAVMVITLYPETAHQELEDINPDDRALRDVILPPSPL
jgi:MFS family permease